MTVRVPALFLALGVSAAPSPTPTETSAPIGADAVWAPPQGFLAAMHRSCDASPGKDFGACFVAEMQRAGASPAAVAFAHRTGDQGWLREYRDTGRVDVACADYPFRANENSVCFLVNGVPPMLDVDDPGVIGRAPLLSNPAYAGLAKKYPRLAVFPGPRFSELAVVAVPLREGAQRFRVDYSLRDGCHACDRVGTLRLDFDFDAAGRLRGTRVSATRSIHHG